VVFSWACPRMVGRFLSPGIRQGIAMLCAVFIFAELSIARERPSQKECESGVAKSCLLYSVDLIRAGRGAESEKLLRNMCDKDVAEGCLGLAVFYRPPDAEAIFGKSCVKSPKICNDMLLSLGYRGDPKYAAKLATSACTAGYRAACEIAKSPDKNTIKRAIQGPEMLKDIEPKITAVRNKNSKRPVDYDLEKFGFAKMEQEILTKKPLDRRIRFPVTECGPIDAASKEHEWRPIIECLGGSDRVWFKIVPDQSQAKTFPEKFSKKLGQPVWMTGTIVELRPTGVLDALVIVTD